MEHVRILRRADHRRMPWRNGGGETTEVAVYPENVDLAGFGWRVSMATVAGDGPFSLFPGIDRTLAILSGDGMKLDIDGMGRHVLTPDSRPLSFPADAATFARLTGGTITDLNVMTRRDLFTHSLDRVSLQSQQRLETRHDWTLLLALSDLEIASGDVTSNLGALDVLLIGGNSDLPLSAGHMWGDAYLIGIDRV